MWACTKKRNSNNLDTVHIYECVCVSVCVCVLLIMGVLQSLPHLLHHSTLLSLYKYKQL